MKTKLLAAGLALGMSTSAMALQIDTTGGGNIAGSVFFSSIGWDVNGNAVIADIRSSAGTNPTAATLYMQNSFSFGGTGTDLLTYQLVLPLVATFDAGRERTTFTLTGANTGTFSLFLDTTPTLNIEAGTGYGNLNGGSLDAGQVEIATGNIAAIGGAGFRVTGDPALGTAPIDTIDGEVNGLDIDSIQMNGSTQFSIDITSKVDAFIVSALDALTVDLTLTNLSYNAPFPDGRASDAVVNHNAVFSDSDSDGTPDLNTNIDCGATSKATCDAQFQVGGNSTFFDPRVPEPATLGLTGLGLTLLGFIGRRRRKS